MGAKDLFKIKDDETLRSRIGEFLTDNYEDLVLQAFFTKGGRLDFHKLTVEEVGRTDGCLTCIVKVDFAEVVSAAAGTGVKKFDIQCRMTITIDANGEMEVADSELL